MKILVVAHYQGDSSPSAIYVHAQAKAYAAMGHQVRMLVPVALGKKGFYGNRFDSAQDQIDGVWHYFMRYVSLSRYGERSANAQSAIAAIRMCWKRLFSDFKPDVIHAHTLGFDSDLGAWLKAKFGCPLVVTTHGSDAANPLERGEHAWLKARCDKADAVVSVSSALREKVRTCAAEARLEVILNGFVAREPSGAARDPYRMIQVCNLIPLKRVDVTIRAFEKLHRKEPRMNLTVIGSGAMRQELEQLCRELNVADSVRFLGQLPNEKVFEELCGAAFFVMVSKPEGFGIAYLEAMSAGCVTVGTKGEGIADLVVNGENGFLVSADDPDAIARVVEACLAREAEASAIAENGRRSVQELTWEQNARQYLALFEEFCK